MRTALLLGLLVANPFVTAISAAPSSSPGFAEAVEPYLREHCLRCHGPARHKGDLRFDALGRDFAGGSETERWIEVITRIGAGEMPPEDEPQPTAEASGRVIEWLSARIKEGEATRMAKRSPVTHYRLSREEYSHAVYDLLGVRYDARAPGAFSEDPDWQGFERLGSELSLSPSHVEKYLKAAAEIIDQAFPDTKPFQLKSHRDALAIDWGNADKRKELDALGITPRIRTLFWPGHEFSYLRPDGGYRQAAGLYRARMQVSGLTPAGGRAPHVTLFSPELDRMIFEADVLAPEDKPVVLEFETFLPAGKFGIKMSNAVPGPSNSPRSGRNGNHVFTTLKDPKSRDPWQRKLTDDEGRPLYPLLIFDWIDWEGPLEKPDDVRKREGLFPAGDKNTDKSSAEEVLACLTRFAQRAWRRPVTREEILPYADLVTRELAAKAPFRAAYKTALLGLLASKNFAYIAEGSPTENRAVLSEWELASRLSFFLWSSLPDEKLLAAAEDGSLRTREGLQAEAARMLGDPKIARFTDSFPRQWLQLKKVGSFPPDQKLYPDYDDWLEQSMILETTHYFDEMFHKNLPLAQFLDSDWTMLNPRLALHYGIDPPATAGFERVTLRPEQRRGGLLTQASVLSLTSDGTRHRPVHRGVWVSQVVFGKTPPPPPPNVNAIEPNPVNEPKATIRQKLAAHKANANCAACHAKIDPLGLAFDNYDAIGRWRTQEIVLAGKGDNPTVDASGQLPDGRTYADAAQFKRLLAARPEPFARAFTTRLAVYALRRSMTLEDEQAINLIVRQTKSRDYRLRDLIEAFITSDLFRQR
jgi:mono/diheme cytochrome c family protein